MRTDIGLDLGTGSTRVLCNHKIVLDKPTAITVNAKTGEPIEFGERAYKTIGRTSERFCSVMPLERGAIAEYDAAELLIKNYLQNTIGKKTLKPRIMVAVPSNLTEIQRRSVINAVEAAGARNVCLIESPLATALDVGINFEKPEGNIVIDIGRATTDIAALSMGGMAKCGSARIGGIDFDDVIIKYVRKRHNIAIGALTAEAIKIKLGGIIKRPLEICMTANGLNLFSGLPHSFEITTTELFTAFEEPANALLTAIQQVFEEIEPEIIADASKNGIFLTGGGSLLFGMDEWLEKELNAKIIVVSNPKTSVINGIGKALTRFSTLKNGDYHFKTLQTLVSD